MRQRRSFVSRRSKPARQWVPLDSIALGPSMTTTTAVKLLEFQAPSISIGTALTSDPPEDQTILRIVGDMLVSVVATATGNRLCLGLMVADVTWTPAALSVTDLDKRFLWHQVYEVPNLTYTALTGVSWGPPNYQSIQSTTPGQVLFETKPETVHVDIKPKVKIEDGKALHLVGYVDQSTSLTGWAVSLRSWRILMQRAGRR